MGAMLEEPVENCLEIDDSLEVASLEVAIDRDDDVNRNTGVM